jgi:hypothetical protein
MTSLNAPNAPDASAPGGAVRSTRVPPFDAGAWSPNEAERELAAELEKILARKPSQRPTPREAQDSDIAVPEADTAHSEADGAQPVVWDSAPGSDKNGDFEWQQHTADGAVETVRETGDVSMQWVDKARNDKRRRKRRNALGWAATVLIGAGILSAAAYALTGWRPDLSGLLALGHKILT